MFFDRICKLLVLGAASFLTATGVFAMDAATVAQAYEQNTIHVRGRENPDAIPQHVKMAGALRRLRNTGDEYIRMQGFDPQTINTILAEERSVIAQMQRDLKLMVVEAIETDADDVTLAGILAEVQRIEEATRKDFYEQALKTIPESQRGHIQSLMEKAASSMSYSRIDQAALAATIPEVVAATARFNYMQRSEQSRRRPDSPDSHHGLGSQ